MVMDVVLFQRRRRQKNSTTTTPSTILELGAIQENGSTTEERNKKITKVEEVPVGVFSMEYLNEDGIDGLFGWDLIKKFYLEMHGPTGRLRAEIAEA